MRTLYFFVTAFFVFTTSLLFAQEKVYSIDNFKKVVVSPHLEVIFEAGSQNNVEVLNSTEDLSKLNVELKGGTLHLYLDDAKITAKSTKTKHTSKNGSWKKSEPIYNGTVAKLKVTYTTLEQCELRGEQDFKFVSPIEQSDFRMVVSGEANVQIQQLNVDDLRVTIYGESELSIESGNVDYQKYVTYGESKVHASSVQSNDTKITSYGEGEYYFNVKDTFKVTSFGESLFEYSGGATLEKKVVLGENEIRKVG